MALLVAAIAGRYPGEKKLHAGIAEAFPEKALPYVRSLAGQGNLLNNFNWGGYLEWQAPAVKEFIDPRNDIFVHEGVMSDYLRATKVAGHVRGAGQVSDSVCAAGGRRSGGVFAGAQRGVDAHV